MCNRYLWFTDALTDHLFRQKSSFVGDLYGYRLSDSIWPISCFIKEDEKKEYKKFGKYKITENNFPSPVRFVGLIYCVASVSDIHLTDDFNDPKNAIHSRLQDLKSLREPLVILYNYAYSTMYCYAYANGKKKEHRYVIIPKETLWDKFLLLRVRSTFSLKRLESELDNATSSIDWNIDNIKRLKNLAFYFDGTDDLITDRNSNLNTWIRSGASKIQCLIDNKERTVYNIKLCYDEEYDKLLTPECEESATEIPVVIDGLVMCKKQDPDVYYLLMGAVRRMLKLHKDYYEKENSTPQVYHIYNPSLAHFVTVLYPSDRTDAELVPIRESIHFGFDTPRIQPEFTRGKACKFGEDDDFGALTDVHIGLKPTAINGEISLVSDHYVYYHYNQNKFNDSGWGCAYRSLQTLFSWYKLQGWTDEPLPMHTEIQQILVDLGDKPQSFVGSRQWIGSLEVSYVLDKLLSVMCRIMTIRKGMPLSTIAYEIANHFKTHGSPIMIGGGLLAHTIIGVQIDDETDDVMFLVLDPHYTGPDKIQSIHSKNGVGWKKSNFWKTDNFYNLCMPYKKSGI